MPRGTEIAPQKDVSPNHSCVCVCVGLSVCADALAYTYIHSVYVHAEAPGLPQCLILRYIHPVFFFF